MTDNDIIKALECCTDCNCKECPCCRIIDGGIHCTEIDEEEILDLINSQKAEVERLEIELKAMRGSANSYKSELKKLNDYNLNLITANTALSNEILEIRTEAIKEFAERLKIKVEYGELYDTTDDYIMTIEHIDNLVKEWTEAEE